MNAFRSQFLSHTLSYLLGLAFFTIFFCLYLHISLFLRRFTFGDLLVLIVIASAIYWMGLDLYRRFNSEARSREIFITTHHKVSHQIGPFTQEITATFLEEDENFYPNVTLRIPGEFSHQDKATVLELLYKGKVVACNYVEE